MSLNRFIYLVVIAIIIWIISTSSSKSAETNFNFANDYGKQVREIYTHDSGRIIIIHDLFDESGKGDKTQGVFVRIKLKPGELQRLEQGKLDLKTYDTSKSFPYNIVLFTIFPILIFFFLLKK